MRKTVDRCNTILMVVGLAGLCHTVFLVSGFDGSTRVSRLIRENVIDEKKAIEIEPEWNKDSLASSMARHIAEPYIMTLSLVSIVAIGAGTISSIALRKHDA